MEPHLRERVPRKRAETRRRLMIAARALLLEEGLGRVSVDAVTDRAGYTRGAFYSNFASMTDLVFAVYEEHTADLLARLQAGRLRLPTAAGQDLDDVVRQLVVGLPFDVEWFAIRVGLSSHASRDARFALQFLDHGSRFEQHLECVLVDAMAAAGRTLTVDPAVFTRALIAAHDGALANSLGDPDPEGIRVLVCTAVAKGLSIPAPS